MLTSIIINACCQGGFHQKYYVVTRGGDYILPIGCFIWRVPSLGEGDAFEQHLEQNYSFQRRLLHWTGAGEMGYMCTSEQEHAIKGGCIEIGACSACEVLQFCWRKRSISDWVHESKLTRVHRRSRCVKHFPQWCVSAHVQRASG